MRVHLSWRRYDGHDAAGVNRVLKLLFELLLFNGIGATFGGAGLLMGWFGAPRSMLDGTPFTDYTIPGWLLLVVVGGTSIGAALAIRNRLRYARIAAILAGAVLLGWIVTEFVMIPGGWAPQLLYFVVALVILQLGRVVFLRAGGGNVS